MTILDAALTAVLEMIGAQFSLAFLSFRPMQEASPDSLNLQAQLILENCIVLNNIIHCGGRNT